MTRQLSDFEKNMNLCSVNNRQVTLEDAEFFQLSKFIVNHFGIKMPSNKKTLLQSKLQKRLKELQFQSFEEYVQYLFSPKGQQDEVSQMIDAVSTNKTEFFREPVHFEFLRDQGLKGYIGLTGKNRLSIWSAGCSSGEEAYSIAMTMNEFLQDFRKVDYRIMATDIAGSMLEHAVTGIYNEEKVSEMSSEFKKKYMLKGRNKYADKVRINPDLREKIEFRKFNLLSNDFQSLGKFDIIFCRNVLIYFDREIQYRILMKFCDVLSKGGYLFLGHSESITGYVLPLKHIRPTIFTKSAD
jgi:chemotaxis protein methyltransferase CheR